MRTPILTLLAALALAALLAARPRVTHDELVLKVDALEARVKALEGARPKAAVPSGVKQGMTQEALEALLDYRGIRPTQKSVSDDGRHIEHWYFARAREWGVESVQIINGVVEGVYYFPSR